jgi:flagellar protein FliS
MQKAAAYRQTEVNASDNVKVISLLYDGAVNFLKMARNRLQNGDISGKGFYIGKTTAIVTELSSSLNMDAGEMAQNLSRLYDYVLDRLLDANLHNDIKAFDEAEGVLETLRSAWKEMEKNRAVNSGQKVANGSSVGVRA